MSNREFETEMSENPENFLRWNLVYDRTRREFSIFDPESKLINTIGGFQAQTLLKILQPKRIERITPDIIKSLKPLLKEAFPREFDDDTTGQAYEVSLLKDQSQSFWGESAIENAERVLTGTCAPLRLKAEDLAYAIIIDERRVKIPLVLGLISHSDIDNKVKELTKVINEHYKVKK